MRNFLDLCNHSWIIVMRLMQHRFEMGYTQLWVRQFTRTARALSTSDRPKGVCKRHFYQLLIPAVQTNFLMPCKSSLQPSLWTFSVLLLDDIIGRSRHCFHSYHLWLVKVVLSTLTSLAKRVEVITDNGRSNCLSTIFKDTAGYYSFLGLMAERGS